MAHYMKPPKVSVLIPNYNYGQFLSAAIDSVLAQDFPDYELLVVDNASTDNSRAVIQRYAGRDGRFRFQINAANIGPVPNWNLCLQEARGDYVRFLFSDDQFAHPQALGKMVAVLDANPAVVLATSAVRLIDEHGRRLYLRDPVGRTVVEHGLEVNVRCLTQTANLVGEPSAVIFRRDAARRGFSLAYPHVVDLEMWLHLLEQGDFAYLAEPLCNFRDHPYRPALDHVAIGLAKADYGRLLREYLAKPWLQARLNRRRLFSTLYTYRRHHGRMPDASGIEQELLRALGRPWYAALWVNHRIERLATDLVARPIRRFRHRRVASP
jgi:glycosyltransferase involved in cell wall biosynthesis